MNTLPTTQTLRTEYSAELAAGRKLRAEAVQIFAGWVFNLPHHLMCQIAQRLDRRTETPRHVTGCV